MSQHRSIRIFVLIDALGWSLVDGREFLSDLLPYRRPLRTILGYSSGAIPTILTGRSPAEHGHWNLFYYDPDGSPFRWLRYLRFLPERFLDNRVVRKLLKELGRRVLGLGSLFDVCVKPHLLPWFNWVEKQNIYAPGGIMGSHSIFDELAREGVPCRVYSYHRFSDAEILHQAKRDLDTSDAEFLFLYLSEMDRFLHGHPHPDIEFAQHLDWYGVGLRAIFERARALDPEATFTILSDHGMAPVRQTFDLVRQVEALGFTMPREYLAVYDSTMARFWFFEDRARCAITERLAAVRCGRIVPDAELRKLGILFPDRRYGELVFLLEPGWLIGGSDFSGHGWTPKGMHGYHPDDPHSAAILLSSQLPPADMQTIADVYTLMSDAAAAASSGISSRGSDR